MSKFKIGDKLRCISDDGWCGSTQGVIWTFAGYHHGDENYIKFKETEHISYANDNVYNWELVDSNPMPELKTGMRVQHRNGDTYMVIKDLNRLYQKNGFNHLSDFNLETGAHETTYGFELPEWDIVKVFMGSDTSNLLSLSVLGDLIWEADDAAKIAKQKRIRELEDILQATQKELDSLSEY